MSNAFRLDGQVAVVTGAGAGIGQAIAVALAEAGADVAITEVPNRLTAAEKTAEMIRGMGRKAIIINLDQTKTDEIKQMVETTVSSLGHLDILVNNAALGITKPALDFSEQDWDIVLDIGLKGAFFCSQEAAKQMIKQGTGGRIINMASILGFRAGFGIISAAYCATKAALVNTTRDLAIEWAKYGITVNGVAPGYVETYPIKKRLESDPELAKDMLGRIPAGRLAQPAEVGQAVVYLASPAAKYIVGHTLVIDGGWTAW